MTEHRYPTGIQTFSELREEGYIYVDKTRYIPLLLKQSKYVFLSRPRRFGKSLLVSTLKAFFEGRRELFKGLDIDRDDIDWTPNPVLHFDFNTGLYIEEDGLRTRLDTTLSHYERIYGIIPDERSTVSLSTRFEILIKRAYEHTGRRVVVLVDEYDKPLLGLSDNHPLFVRNQKILKSFYGNLKSMDEYIRFGFLTGVARFSKVSIFSDLNNLDDISLDDRYGEICGLTEAEVVGNCREGIEVLAKKRGEDYETTLSVLRCYYDGYLFTTEGSRLYNPYSVLRAFKAESIDPFWFATGTPTFLVDSIRDNRIKPMDINGQACTRYELLQVGIGSTNPIPLMFQTGYLTIDHYDPDMNEYVLRFPNREVEMGFSNDLLPLYLPGADQSWNPLSLREFRRDLFSGDVEKFMKRLSTAMKDLPVEDQCEAVYRAITYLLCKLCSLDARVEQHSYRGHSDMEVITRGYIYVFEFKYNKSVREAMDQILSRDYAGRYALDSRKVYLIGVNYTDSKAERGLQYEIKEFLK